MSEIILWIFAIIGMLTVGVGLIALVVNLFSLWIGRGDSRDSFLRWCEKEGYGTRGY